MKPADVIREITYPLTSLTIVLAMLFFGSLFILAQEAGLFGIALFALTLPAFFRFLLYLLEARANSRQAPVPTIEMFNPAENLWSLTPLIFVALLIWAQVMVTTWAWLFVPVVIFVVVLLFAPASMAILAITHSPSEAMNPAAIWRMIRACGGSYLLVPGVNVVLGVVWVLLGALGVPSLFVDFGTAYQVVLVFSFTGAVLRVKDLATEVEIEAPLEPGEDEIRRDLEKERQKVANHAYGFISRGNRDGGFAHIRQWIESESEPVDASRWFFREMMSWDSNDPALFFAQPYLRQLLDWQQEAEALKVISRCLHEDPRWKPLPADRAEVLEMVERIGRDDLLRPLRN